VALGKVTDVRSRVRSGTGAELTAGSGSDGGGASSEPQPQVPNPIAPRTAIEPRDRAMDGRVMVGPRYLAGHRWATPTAPGSALKQVWSLGDSISLGVAKISATYTTTDNSERRSLSRTSYLQLLRDDG